MTRTRRGLGSLACAYVLLLGTTACAGETAGGSSACEEGATDCEDSGGTQTTTAPGG